MRGQPPREVSQVRKALVESLRTWLRFACRWGQNPVPASGTRLDMPPTAIRMSFPPGFGNPKMVVAPEWLVRCLAASFGTHVGHSGPPPDAGPSRRPFARPCQADGRLGTPGPSRKAGVPPTLPSPGHTPTLPLKTFTNALSLWEHCYLEDTSWDRES